MRMRMGSDACRGVATLVRDCYSAPPRLVTKTSSKLLSPLAYLLIPSLAAHRYIWLVQTRD